MNILKGMQRLHEMIKKKIEIIMLYSRFYIKSLIINTIQ